VKIELSLSDIHQLSRLGELSDREWNELCSRLVFKVPPDVLMAIYSARFNMQVAMDSIVPISNLVQ